MPPLLVTYIGFQRTLSRRCHTFQLGPRDTLRPGGRGEVGKKEEVAAVVQVITQTAGALLFVPHHMEIKTIPLMIYFKKHPVNVRFYKHIEIWLKMFNCNTAFY